MNYIKAAVSRLESVDGITIVTFEKGESSLKMMALEMADSLQEGMEVILGAKATNVSLAKDLEGLLSISNRLPCTISGIDQGRLLCSVKLDFLDTALESIITKDSALRMGLKEGEEITALIKASELSIIEVL